MFYVYYIIAKKNTQRDSQIFVNFPRTQTNFLVIVDCIMDISIWANFRIYVQCENVMYSGEAA